MIRRGAVFVTPYDVMVQVTRVARDGSWADIVCVDAAHARWVKRQPLPFPDTWKELR